MSLIITYAGKIASTNQKLLIIKTSLGKDVYLKNYVLCFLNTSLPVKTHDLFLNSLNLPDYILKNGDELRVYVGKGETQILKSDKNKVYQIYWNLDENLFSSKKVFYSIEYIERIALEKGMY